MDTTAKPSQTIIVIFGAGEIAQIANFYFSQTEDFEVCAFVVDDEYAKEKDFCSKPLIGLSELAQKFPASSYDAFVAISYANMNRVRQSKFETLKKMGYNLVSYVSPQCTCYSKEIGENCFIFEDNTIQPYAQIGNNVTLWSGNHIGHHSKINDNCFITSHVVISGGVNVGVNCFIGVNASIRDHITIGDYTLIGAGALITKNTEPKSVYRGFRSEPLELTSDQMKI